MCRAVLCSVVPEKHAQTAHTASTFESILLLHNSKTW